MDYQRFDQITRSLAATTSRRRVLHGLVGGAAGGLLALLGSGRTVAQPGCRGGGETCGRANGGNTSCCSAACCTGVCCDEENVCVAGACCPTQQACFDVCCPPETVGCVPPKDLADGTTTGASCLCAEGLLYRDGQCAPCAGNGCSCERDEPCCSGVCCKGECYPSDVVCCGGEPCYTNLGYVCDHGVTCRCDHEKQCPIPTHQFCNEWPPKL